MKNQQPKNEEEVLLALCKKLPWRACHEQIFSDKAAFYGGTALRIFYNLDRFSEDLDFSLLQADSDFSLEPYFSAIVNELTAQGLKVSIREKDKKAQTAFESAFLKTETIWKKLVLEDMVKQAGIKSNRSVKIKIEVDHIPPNGFETEAKVEIGTIWNGTFAKEFRWMPNTFCNEQKKPLIGQNLLSHLSKFKNY